MVEVILPNLILNTETFCLFGKNFNWKEKQTIQIKKFTPTESEVRLMLM